MLASFCYAAHMMIAYTLGIFVCWMAAFIGNKAQKIAGSSTPLSIVAFRRFAELWLVAGFLAGFYVFDWWLPLVAIAITPLVGSVYVKLETYLSKVTVSVPLCAIAGSVLLSVALFYTE